MAMRVSLARALVTSPLLLLLDEPFAALDEITRRQLAEDVHGLWAGMRPAIVFVTHNVEEAVYMASRVVVLSRGPGLVQAEAVIDGPLPRPPGFRTSAGFRRSVEQVSAELKAGMEPAA
jgi:NitT/TauT family transport system ATP-binding protein